MTEELEATVAGGLPEEIPVGQGTCAVLQGSCSADGRRVRSVRLLLDGQAQALSGKLAGSGSSGAQGWWAVADLPATEEPRSVLVELDARIGRRRRRRALGTVRLVPGWAPPQLDFKEAADRGDGSVTGARSLGPKIAICLATDALDVKRFRTLAKDLRAQTYRNWVCIVCDAGSPARRFDQLRELAEDWPRFTLERRDPAAGVGDALERALELAPADAPYAVLTDLDHDWPPTLLADMLAALDSGSNAVILDDPAEGSAGDVGLGSAQAPRELETGIESLADGEEPGRGPILFRRQLLRYLIPFPPPGRRAGPRPRRWLTLVARAVGGVTVLELAANGRPGGTDGARSRAARDRLLTTVVPVRVLQTRVGAYLTRHEIRRLRRIGSGGYPLRRRLLRGPAPSAGAESGEAG